MLNLRFSEIEIQRKRWQGGTLPPNSVSWADQLHRLFSMRVLLIEDDAALAAATIYHLKRNGFATDHAATLALARAALPVAPWDALLLDLHLPDGDGLSLIPVARRAVPGVSIIVLTASDKVRDRVRGLDAGADDYLVKPFAPEELLARLRAVERRRSGVNSSVVRVGALVVDLTGMRVSKGGMPVTVTAKEWGVLRVLASRLDRIHSKAALKEAIYGFDDEVSSNTVEVFVRNIRAKLGANSIENVRGLGYRLTGEAS